MKNTAKLVVISSFALGALFIFLSINSFARIGAANFSEVTASPTPPKNTAINATSNMNAVKATPATAPANAAANTSTVPPSGGGKSIPKEFTLGTDSLDSTNGEAEFNHDNHAFLKYSPDGTQVMGCVECHHTDQPKSALKAPDVTSERDVTLTFDVWKTSSQKVSKCRDCHFQDGNVPDGKTMPTANGKDMNNQIAFHINCNTCHDAAFKLRPDLKKTSKKFATTKDCGVCHKPVSS